MPYSYTKKTWTNNSGTPLNATNLTDHENALHKGNAHMGTSAPSDTDREWFDTNTNPPTLKVYSGGSWVAVSAGESLKAADRTTRNAADGWATSAGWFPTARYFDADKATTYYRDPGNIRARPIPTGLKMLTHRAVFKDHLTTMHFCNCVRVDGVGRPILNSSNHESHLYEHLGTDANGPSLAEKPSSCVSRPIARGQSANVKVLLAGVAADVPAATRTLFVA